jgi:hypothetical protein
MNLSSHLADADRALRDARFRLGETPDDNTNAAVTRLMHAVESILGSDRF